MRRVKLEISQGSLNNFKTILQDCRELKRKNQLTEYGKGYSDAIERFFKELKIF